MTVLNGGIIRVSAQDLVGTVVEKNGLTTIYEHIPMGHKVALRPIHKDEPIIKFGVPIGHAISDIPEGAWVHSKNMKLCPAPELDKLPSVATALPVAKPLEGYTFKGYKNSDGSVGTKNVLAIATSVQCVAGFADHLASRICKELLPQYPNVDAVVPINHGYGCGVALSSPLSKIPVRTLQHILKNPNFGNQVMILGLGCEKLRPEQLLDEVQQIGDRNIMYMQDSGLHGFQAMVNQAMKLAEQHLMQLNKRQREPCDASELVVGLQCGGSDGFSGLTGNPVAGYAADLMVRAGGSVMFSEVTEVRDAIHLLAPRAINEKVRQSLIDEMKWYDKYLSQGQADRSANPTPGNHRGGLSNVVEKAMGSVVKSGTSPIVEVIPAGERCSKKGLSFAATPASDFVCGTLQVAAGMNMHVFVTGRGSPYGLSMVPVVKVSTNSELARRWHDLIDIDAGVVATGERTIEEMGWKLFEFILEVASGNKVVASDRLGLHNDLVLFNPGPVT